MQRATLQGMVLLCLLFPVPGSSAPPETAPEPLLQLGATRFRHVGMGGPRVAHWQLSPDGKRLATFSAERSSVRNWDVVTGKVLNEFSFPGAAYNIAVVWSPDGKWLATAEQFAATPEKVSETTLHLRDASTGKLIRSIPYPKGTRGRQNGDRPIQFLPGGKEIAAQTTRGMVIWEIATGLELIHLRLPNTGHANFAISPDGKRFVFPDTYTHKIHYWDWESGKELQEWNNDLLLQLKDALFTPDGKAVLFLPQTATQLVLMDLASGRQIRTFEIPGKRRRFESFAFTPDGKHLLAAEDGGRHTDKAIEEGGIVRWDVATGKVVSHWKVPGEVRALSLSSDGKYVALHAPGMPVWEVATGRRVNPDTVEDRINATAVAAGSGYLLTLGDEGIAQLWDAKTGRPLHTFRHEHPYVRSGAISPDGTRIATGGLEAIRVWDAKSGELLFKLPHHGLFGRGPVLVFRSDGKVLYSIGSDFFLRATELTHGKAVAEYALRPNGLVINEGDEKDRMLMMRLISTDPAFSPDGSRLLMESSVFNTASGKELQILSESWRFSPWESSFSRDGTRLLKVERASTVTEKLAEGWRQKPLSKETLRCYDVASTEVLWTLDLESRNPPVLAMAPDGRTFALSEPNLTAKHNSITFHNLSDGTVIGRLDNLPAWVRHVTYLPDGRSLAVTFPDGIVRVYAIPR